MKGMSHKPRPQSPFASDAEAATAGLANMTAFVPGVGDAAGLLADAVMYRDNPKQRTLRNMGLTALGVLPFVPALASMGKATRNVPSGMGNQVGAITYHGSPHRINNVTPDAPYGKFDLSKVGTGEGAQAFGHGIYLAESPGVAKTYMRNVAELTMDGQTIGNWAAANRAEYTSLPKLTKDALEFARHDVSIDAAYTNAIAQGRDDIADEIQRLVRAKRLGNAPPGHFYTVDLPDEHIAKMLDWDAPLSEQPEAVRKIFAQYGAGERLFPYEDKWIAATDKDGWAFYGSEVEAVNGLLGRMTGEDLYRAISKIDGQDRASQLFKEAGIPGIKYFDGNSRADGKGTRNFVIFDGDTAKILKRE